MVSNNTFKNNIPKRGIPEVLYNLNQKGVEGCITLHSSQGEKKIFIKNKKILFASSSINYDQLGQYMVRNKIINNETLREAGCYSKKYEIRFGRALVELGYINYNSLWDAIYGHLREIIFSTFSIKKGYFYFSYGTLLHENITLNEKIPLLIIKGIRAMEKRHFNPEIFLEIKNFFLFDENKFIKKKYFFPYELHVIDLINKYNSLEEITKNSELKVEDTYRTLYMFLVLKVLTTEKEHLKNLKNDENQEDNIPTVFNNSMEALEYHNKKYKFIFFYLKNISGCNADILKTFINDSLKKIDKQFLPPYLHNVKINSSGEININKIYKSVWYIEKENPKNITKITKGLEEIYFTILQSVKQNLGVNSYKSLNNEIKKTFGN